MEENLKQLLLKDLCARLPYGVKVIYSNIIMEIFVISTFLNNTCCLKWDSHKGYYNQTNANIGKFMPYLRLMSSMTEKERKEYEHIAHGIEVENGVRIPNVHQIDWLNAHHFDYRGLIEKNLALEAPEGIYKIE